MSINRLNQCILPNRQNTCESPKTKGLCKTKMPEGGLEPPRIAPYAPETHVSTIPPLRHLFYTIKFSILLYFMMHSVVEVVSSTTLSSNVTFSHLLVGRVPLRHLFLLSNFNLILRHKLYNTHVFL